MAFGLKMFQTQDLYYICQMVDNVARDPGSYFGILKIYLATLLLRT